MAQVVTDPEADAPLGSLKSPLMNERQAAALLGIQPTTLRRWRWVGKGPLFVRVGGCIRYSTEEIAAYIAAGKRRSTSDPGYGQ